MLRLSSKDKPSQHTLSFKEKPSQHTRPPPTNCMRSRPIPPSSKSIPLCRDNAGYLSTSPPAPEHLRCGCLRSALMHAADDLKSPAPLKAVVCTSLGHCINLCIMHLTGCTSPINISQGMLDTHSQLQSFLPHILTKEDSWAHADEKTPVVLLGILGKLSAMAALALALFLRT